MPTYQYACTECSHRFETVQTFHEDSLTHCPECDGRLRKVFNAVGVVFKGSGFYRTDSRASSESGSSDSGKSDSDGSDSGKSDSGKSESTKSESSSKPDTGSSNSTKSDAAKSTSSSSTTATTSS